jgi:hypothetical protein
LEKRWGALQVVRTSTAVLKETTLDSDGYEKVILSDISKQGVLWKPSYTDATKRLTLYVWDHFDAKLHGEALCRWFAHEVFRLRDLTRGFNSLLNDPKSYYVNPAMVTDAKALIDSWLGEALLEALVKYLQIETGLPIDISNWKDLNFYGTNNFDFQNLLVKAPDELKSLIVFLNPQQRNVDNMQSYLFSIETSIAALPAPHSRSVQQWLDLFNEDEKRFVFSLDVAIWFMSKLGMTQAEFEKYGGCVDLELQRAQAEEGIIQVVDRAIVAPSLKMLSIGSITERESEQAVAPSLMAVQSDAARAKKQLSQSRSGKSAETQLACYRAKHVNALTIKDKTKFLSFLNSEYQRLNLHADASLKVLLAKDAKEFDENAWKRLMHIGAIVDGPGYDLLDYDDNLEKLLLIEVKSSKEEKPVIHVSENERKQALYLSSTEFLSNSNAQWRLYLVPANGIPQDISDNVLTVLRAHDDTLHKREHIQAESWLLSGLLNNGGYSND